SILDQARAPPSIQFRRSSCHARRPAPRPAVNGVAELWDRIAPTVATNGLPLSHSPRNTGSRPADTLGAPNPGSFRAPFQRLLSRKRIAGGCETNSRVLRTRSRWDGFAGSPRAVEGRCKTP